MLYYNFTLFILFILSLFETSLKKEKLFINILSLIILIYLVIQVGFRWETGTDWNSYLNHFTNISLKNFTDATEGFYEVGYNIFVLTCKLISNNYSFFLVIHSLLFYILIFKSFKYFTPNIFLCLLLFYALNLGLLGSNRQLLALAIGFYSLRFLIKSWNFTFLLFIIIASFFHMSAILFLIYYFLKNKISLFKLLALFTIAATIGFLIMPKVFNLEFSFLPAGYTLMKLLTYLEKSETTTFVYPIFGLLKRTIIVSYFLINRSKFSKYNPLFNIVLNGYLIGILFFLLFSYTIPLMISRGSIYFNIMEPILLSYIILLYKDMYIKYLIIILLTIFSILLLSQSISPYKDLFDPYKGLFINNSYNRVLY